MTATFEKEGPAGYGFTLSEVAAATHARANPADPSVEGDRGGKEGWENRASRSRKRTRTSNHAWCARLAAARNIPQPPIEEALALLNQDRLLVENVLNTAEQMGFGPMTIVETILERRG